MSNSNKKELKYPLSTQKQVDLAISYLKDLYFELELSSRIYSECLNSINRYYLNCPDSGIKASTLVGCIVYLISTRYNEHLSIATVANKVGVSIQWLSKIKKRIERDLNK